MKGFPSKCLPFVKESDQWFYLLPGKKSLKNIKEMVNSKVKIYSQLFYLCIISMKLLLWCTNYYFIEPSLLGFGELCVAPFVMWNTDHKRMSFLITLMIKSTKGLTGNFAPPLYDKHQFNAIVTFVNWIWYSFLCTNLYKYHIIPLQPCS